MANNKGLFGKLLLPGFTDAGANTSFRPSNHSSDPEVCTDAHGDGAARDQLLGAVKDVHDNRISRDQLSEVATEVHDNRTSRDQLSEVATEVHDNRTSKDQLSEVATEVHDNRTSSSSALVKDQLSSENNDNNKTITATADTPESNRNNNDRQQQQPFRPDNNNNEERNIKGFFPTTKPPKSPRHPIPKSPTTIRHQSPVSPPNVARRQPPARSLSTTVSIATTSAVPETVACHEDSSQQLSQEENKQETERDNENNSKNLQQNHLLVKRQQRERELNKNNDNELREAVEAGKAESDVSDVLSTASIMGTVINIGDMTEKMAEIDAMAAFIEQASPQYENSTLLEATNDMKEGLSLPMFTEASDNASKDSEQPTVLPRKNSGNSRGKGNGGKENMVYDLLNTSTAGMANATKSSIVFSAAIRRAGRKSHNNNSPLSAPTTPRTPGAPPRVEDLLKSTLSPRSSVLFHPPASFALRSPGSSARMRILRHTNKAISNNNNNNTYLKPRFSQSIHRSIPTRLANQDDDDDNEEHRIRNLNIDINSSTESSNVVTLRTPQRVNIERKTSLDEILQTASSIGLESSTIAKDDDNEEEEDTVTTALEEKVESCERADKDISEIDQLKAMLKSVRMELEEKIESNRNLDEELCQCRAEIGRLKSVEQLPIAPNRSVMDVDDHTEDSEPSPDRVNENETPVITEKRSSDSGDSKMFDESFINGSNSFCQDRQVESERLDAIVKTLEEANNTIRRLHGELHKGEPDCEQLAPVVKLSNAIIHGLEERTLQPVDESHRADENFVTEWDDLAPPLPPPPNHGLHSPIVSAILQQWTNDRALHNSLIRWMERVITEGDVNVPPLTISSLDRQLQIDFTTHVLPLLLQRPDVDVAVQTRTHRQTTYDLAVRVSHQAHESLAINEQKQSLFDDHDSTNIDDGVENSSVANSAVTELTVNGGLRAHAHSNIYQHKVNKGEHGLSHCASAELDNALDHEYELQQQNTIMGALGGALGGFLGRTKPSASPSRTLTPSPFPYSHIHDPHEQPYHRVVSAPPGRIGVTFVNFQGHAMVSDVAPNSPLSSWIFASDILIAIDEVPVSGMRVRDIIKVLTNRKDRQRALRVISSHAMNESILNESNLTEEPN